MTNHETFASAPTKPVKPYSESNPATKASYLHELIEAAYTIVVEMPSQHTHGTGLNALLHVLIERSSDLANDLDHMIFESGWSRLVEEMERDRTLGIPFE